MSEKKQAVSQQSNYTSPQIEEWKTKAEKWDKLGKKIQSMYVDENGNELAEDNDFDLGTIGEAAAMAYGWL